MISFKNKQNNSSLYNNYSVGPISYIIKFIYKLKSMVNLIVISKNITLYININNIIIFSPLYYE